MPILEQQREEEQELAGDPRRRAVIAEERLAQDEDRRLMTLNMGPQHPSTHGVLRVILTLDGETVVDAEPVLGYLHRCHEKIYESLTYPQIVPFTDRTDYLGSICDEQLVCETVEKAMGLEVPERAQYLRVIFNEFQRIVSHDLWFGAYSLDLGAQTAFLYAFREREHALRLLDASTGARLLYNYLRIGGVRNDLSDGWFEDFEDFLDLFEQYAWPEYYNLVIRNAIFERRTRGVGVISKADAIAYGASGPVARASGMEYDVRKARPYSIYDRFDFEVPVGENGDCYDRAVVRMYEMLESVKIIRQALKEMPDGPVMGKVPRAIRPKGEIYHTVEGPRGEYGCHLVSDGGVTPYRIKWRAADFVNLQMLPAMVRGNKVADVVACIGSIDLVMGSVDR